MVWRFSQFYGIPGAVRIASSHLLSVLGFVLFAGCSSDPVGGSSTDGGVDAAAVDASSAKDASSDTNNKDAATGCVDHCKVNSDCENSCPATSGSSHCCDQGSGKCYAFASAQCPADPPPVDDGGVTPPY